VNARVTVLTHNKTVLALVGDFARGVGCQVDAANALTDGSLRIDLPDAGDLLLELLDYIALSATKAGVEPGEPLCRVSYRRPGARAQVTLGLRIAELSLDP